MLTIKDLNGFLNKHDKEFVSEYSVSTVCLLSDDYVSKLKIKYSFTHDNEDIFKSVDKEAHDSEYCCSIQRKETKDAYVLTVEYNFMEEINALKKRIKEENEDV